MGRRKYSVKRKSIIKKGGGKNPSILQDPKAWAAS